MMGDRRGFSLAEVLVSIGALALVSIYVLQMFVLSSQVHERARGADTAQLMTNSLLEQFLSCEAPAALDTYPLLDGADVSGDEAGVYAHLYLAADWQRVPKGSAQARYVVSCEYTWDEYALPPLHAELDGTGDAQHSRLATLWVEITQHAADTDLFDLASGSATRYVQGVGV